MMTPCVTDLTAPSALVALDVLLARKALAHAVRRRTVPAAYMRALRAWAGVPAA